MRGLTGFERDVMEMWAAAAANAGCGESPGVDLSPRQQRDTYVLVMAGRLRPTYCDRCGSHHAHVTPAGREAMRIDALMRGGGDPAMRSAESWEPGFPTA